MAISGRYVLILRVGGDERFSAVSGSICGLIVRASWLLRRSVALTLETSEMLESLLSCSYAPLLRRSEGTPPWFE